MVNRLSLSSTSPARGSHASLDTRIKSGYDPRFKLLHLFLTLFLAYMLSGCGFVLCPWNNSDNSCTWGNTTSGSGSGGWYMPIPPLPDLSSLAVQQYKTQSIFVSGSNSGWTLASANNTTITINNGDQITIQIQPTSTYPSGQNQFLSNGFINACYTSGNVTSFQMLGSGNAEFPGYALANTIYVAALDPNQPHGQQTFYYSDQTTGTCPSNSTTSPPCPNSNQSYYIGGCTGTFGQGPRINLAIPGGGAQQANLTCAERMFDSIVDPANQYFTNGIAIVPFNAPQIQSQGPQLGNDLSIYVPTSEQQNDSISNLVTNYNLYILATGCFHLNDKIQFIISDAAPATGTPGTVINGSATFTSGATGNLYLNFPDTDDGNYSNNVGQFEVQITTPIPQTLTFIDTMTSSVINAVQMQVNNISQQFYDSIISSPNFQNIVNACLVLYIIIYGISFTIGIVAISQKDIVVRIIKIAVIIILISDNSWYFFNTYLFNGFRGGLTYIASIAGGGTGSESSLFEFADQAMRYILNTGVWCRILTFILLWPIGWFIFMMIMSSILTYVLALLEAFVAYLLALTAISIFIAIAPLFIILILFQHTRGIFDEWLKIMGGMIIQTALLFGCIAIVNALVLDALNNLLSDSEFRCILPFFIPLYVVTIYVFCFYALLPDPFDILGIITLTLILYILTELLKKLPSFAQSMGQYVSSAGAGAVSGGANITQSLKAGAENVKGFFGMDKASKDRRQEKNQKGTEGVDAKEGGGGAKPRT